MKIIVPDSNIIFSSLRQPESRFLTLLERGGDFVFYAPNFMVVELFKHRERLRKKSKLSEEEFIELLNQFMRGLKFFNESFISTRNFIFAHQLCRDVDPKDTPFVALVLETNGQFWTRDDEIRRGLLKKGFDRFFNEHE